MAHDIGTVNLNSMGKVGAIIYQNIEVQGVQSLRFTHPVNGVVEFRPKAKCLYIQSLY